MRYQSFLVCTFLALVVLICPSVDADILTLKDGTTIEGKILSESRNRVVIETKISNIKTTKTLTRREIAEITYQPLADDFWDSEREKPQDAPPALDVPTIEKEDAPEPESISESPDKTPRSTGEKTFFAIVPIQGGIGVEVNAYGLRKALTNIARQRIEHVVFVIDSPGGYIYSAVDMMEILKEFDEKLIYHAVIEEGAISAASIFAACADNIYVRPGSRLGGAVAYSKDDSTGSAKVDAKMNSIWASEVASRAEAKGHMGELFRAMAVLEVQLWQAPDGTISAANSPGAEQIDTSSTILTIRANQLVRAGMAQEIVGELDGLGELLGIEQFTERKRTGTREMTQASQAVAKLNKRYEKAMEVYETSNEILEREDPISHTDYTIYRNLNSGRGSGKSFKYAFDQESMTLWRNRTDAAVDACHDMIAALKEAASISSKANKYGALHLITSTNSGNQSFSRIDGLLNRLNFQRDNPPYKSMVD